MMKEITRIHLARVAYNIEIAARKQLESYLAEVEKALEADDETMAEIEARIVEILAARGVHADDIVTADDVAKVQSQLGDPSEFVDDTMIEDDTSHTTLHRLMRSTDNAVIGGVCGGIGEYFHLNVTGVRLATIGLTVITGGLLVPLYAVLWIVLRPARTAADRLQLRGEKVTPAAMKKLVSRENTVTLERSRPAVLAIRVVLAIGFGLAAIGAIALAIGAVVARQLFIGNDFHADTGWIITAGALAIFAGILFATLMVLAMVASARWKLTRQTVVAAAVIIFVGLTSFGLAVAVGGYAIGRANSVLDAEAQSETVIQTVANLPLNGNAPMTIDNNLTMNHVEYHVTNERPHAEIRYLSSQQRPHIKVSAKNDIIITLSGKCNGAMAMHCLLDTNVVLYGPALSELTIPQGSVNYYPTSQAKLTVALQPNTTLTMSGGHIDALSGSVGTNANITNDDDTTTTSLVNLRMAAGGYGSFGSVDHLTLAVPDMCSDDGAVSVDYRAVGDLIVNGRAMMRDTLDNHCLQLNGN